MERLQQQRRIVGKNQKKYDRDHQTLLQQTSDSKPQYSHLSTKTDLTELHKTSIHEKVATAISKPGQLEH